MGEVKGAKFRISPISCFAKWRNWQNAGFREMKNRNRQDFFSRKKKTYIVASKRPDVVANSSFISEHL